MKRGAVVGDRISAQIFASTFENFRKKSAFGRCSPYFVAQAHARRIETPACPLECAQQDDKP
jgi:hypothetical protein